MSVVCTAPSCVSMVWESPCCRPEVCMVPSCSAWAGAGGLCGLCTCSGWPAGSTAALASDHDGVVLGPACGDSSGSCLAGAGNEAGACSGHDATVLHAQHGLQEGWRAACPGGTKYRQPLGSLQGASCHLSHTCGCRQQACWHAGPGHRPSRLKQPLASGQAAEPLCASARSQAAYQPSWSSDSTAPTSPSEAPQLVLVLVLVLLDGSARLCTAASARAMPAAAGAAAGGTCVEAMLIAEGAGAGAATASIGLHRPDPALCFSIYKARVPAEGWSRSSGCKAAVPSSLCTC